MFWIMIKKKISQHTQQNGRGSDFWLNMRRLAKATADSLIPDLDWSDVLICSGGLLLVGSDLLLSQVHVHGWSLASINK
jgi:hypothetical protein